jgi:hypothetical protein
MARQQRGSKPARTSDRANNVLRAPSFSPYRFALINTLSQPGTAAISRESSINQ